MPAQISVNGGAAGKGILNGNVDGVTLADVGGGSPISRLWSIQYWPAPLLTPPTLTTPALSSSGFSPPIDGTYQITLTRLEADGITTTTQSVLVGVPNTVGFIVPSPGVDEHLYASFGSNPTQAAAARLAGWMGSAAGGTGVLFDAYIRELEQIAENVFGGDLAKVTPTSQHVIGLYGRSIANTAPSDGQFLTWSAGGNFWTPTTLVGTVPATPSTFAYRGTDGSLLATAYGLGPRTAPAAPGTGWWIYNDTADGNIKAINASSVIKQLTALPVPLVGDIGKVASVSGAGAYTLVAGSSLFTPGGDLTGTSTSQTVAKIQGKAVSSTAPTDGQFLMWSTTDNQYEPTTKGPTRISGVASTFTSPVSSGPQTACIFPFDPSAFPAPADRVIKFEVVLQVPTSGDQVTCVLTDVTDAVVIHTFTSSSLTPDDQSVTLALGAAAANTIPNSKKLYQVTIQRTAGTPGDGVTIHSGFFEVSY